MPVVNVYSLAELALMAALAVQCARFAWVLATPVTPLGEWRPAAPMVAGADILGSFDPFFRLGGGAGAPATVTTLQLTLFGTRIDEAMGGGSAIIAGPDGVQQSVAVGAEIQPGVRLKSVAFDHVTIERGGADEDLFLDQSGAVTPVTPGVAPVAGAAPAAVGVQIGQLRQDIGFIPRIDAGRISGLTVRSQGSGAAFRAAGLKDGDVLTSIGGRPVSGPGDLDRIAKDFAGGGNVPITVERGQDTLTLTITIAPPAMKPAQ
ncbi:type II secretion system protein N [Sphingomonas sp. R86521]|uniref:type II secretion system protein N n=1 Tax=Sphingomonas sp. R86521 TaxID=3093860 RepID=UPI0036D410D3